MVKTMRTVGEVEVQKIGKGPYRWRIGERWFRWEGVSMQVLMEESREDTDVQLTVFAVAPCLRYAVGFTVGYECGEIDGRVKNHS